MSRKVKFSASALLVAAMAVLMPVTSFAMRLQSDYLYTNEIATPADELGGIAALVFFAIWCLVIVFFLGVFVVWVLSIIDIVKRDNWKSDNDKIIWLLLIVFFNIISLYYYFFYRKSLDKSGSAEKTQTPV